MVNTLNDYQQQANTTATYPDRGGPFGFFYAVSQLASEAGEVSGKFAKQIRDKESDFSCPKFREAVVKELGDVLWYVSETALQLGFDLSEVAQINLDKLASRKARGVIGGSGDNR